VRDRRKGEILAVALAGGRTCPRAARTSSNDEVDDETTSAPNGHSVGAEAGRVEGGRRMSPLDGFEGRRAIERLSPTNWQLDAQDAGIEGKTPQQEARAGAALEVNGDSCSSVKTEGTQDGRGKIDERD
jgi:hypothetical protein